MKMEPRECLEHLERTRQNQRRQHPVFHLVPGGRQKPEPEDEEAENRRQRKPSGMRDFLADAHVPELPQRGQHTREPNGDQEK